MLFSLYVVDRFKPRVKVYVRVITQCKVIRNITRFIKRNLSY